MNEVASSAKRLKLGEMWSQEGNASQTIPALDSQEMEDLALAASLSMTDELAGSSAGSGSGGTAPKTPEPARESSSPGPPATDVDKDEIVSTQP